MTSKALVDRLENVIGIEGTPRRLLSAIDRELADHFGLPPIQASERAEKIEAAVARIIAQRIASSETDKYRKTDTYRRIAASMQHVGS